MLFVTWRVGAAVLFASTLAGAAAAQAAPATPWSPDACRNFAKQVSGAIRLEAATSDGDPKTVVDDAPAGRACLITAAGNGLTQTFADAEGRLEKLLIGWKQIPEISGGGPGDMFQAYAKDNRQVIVLLRREPPAGSCADVVEAACKVPAKRWHWTFKAAAYKE